MTDETATGVYIAYPRTEQFSAVPEGPDTLVNRHHTQVGVARDSFAATGREYRRRFGDRVKFIPVAEVPATRLREVEKLVLAAVGNLHPCVGASRNWFDTQDRDSIISVIYRLLTPAANEPDDNRGDSVEKAI